MPKTRINYGVQDLLVGAPDVSKDVLFSNKELLQRIMRVQSVSYGVNATRTEVKELGNSAYAAKIINKPPEINLSFQYLTVDVANEIRIGLTPEWNLSGINKYTRRKEVFLLSGMADQSRKFDSRNYYITINQTGQESHDPSARSFGNISGDLETQLVDPRGRNFNVICFTNAYLNHYRVEGAVGDFLKCNVDAVCEDITFFLSGSGNKIPKLDPRNRVNQNNTYEFLLPKYYRDVQPTVLGGKDITITISPVIYVTASPFKGIGIWLISKTGASGRYSYQLQSNSTLYPLSYIDVGPNIEVNDGQTVIAFENDPVWLPYRTSGGYRFACTPISGDDTDLGLTLFNANLQSFAIDVPIQRETVQFLADRSPTDRPIRFPVEPSINFSILNSDMASGSVSSLFNKDQPYNMTILVKNPQSGASGHDFYSLRYDIKEAFFDSINTSNGIGDNQITSLSFRGELAPNFFTRTVYLSGTIEETDMAQNLLQTENSGLVLATESGDNLVSDEFMITPEMF